MAAAARRPSPEPQAGTDGTGLAPDEVVGGAGGTSRSAPLGRARRRSPKRSLRQGADRAGGALRALVPMAVGLVRVVRTYALVTALAGLLVLVALAWRLAPWGPGDGLLLVVVLAVVAVPVALLWLFGQALREVAELPEKVGRLPDSARTNATELAALAREARDRRRRGGPGSLPGDLWRAGRLLLGAQDALPGYGAVLALVRVPFLIASAVAAVVAALIIVLALPVTAALVLSGVL